MLIPAHRYVLQLVIRDVFTRMAKAAMIVLSVLAGAAFGVAVCCLGTLAIAGFVEWVIGALFPTGF